MKPANPSAIPLDMEQARQELEASRGRRIGRVATSPIVCGREGRRSWRVSMVFI